LILFTWKNKGPNTEVAETAEKMTGFYHLDLGALSVLCVGAFGFSGRQG
tara:strand:- start:139 stop:285 length:147 start_codon:yes stop_codon:yes gene_type:complete